MECNNTAGAFDAVKHEQIKDSPENTLTLEQLRLIMQKFASERDWNQFHTPQNLTLALVGEVGELAECFQWKGDTAPEAWSTAELTHLGEELSDVLLYLVRVADQSGVNLTSVIHEMSSHTEAPADHHDDDVLLSSEMAPILLARVGQHTTSSYPIKDNTVQVKVNEPQSSCRTLVFSLVVQVGQVAGFFITDVDHTTSLPPPSHPLDWSEATRNAFGVMLGSVLCRVVQLSVSSGISLAIAVLRKMELNRRKYPVHLVHGSSQKYTAYRHQLTASQKS